MSVIERDVNPAGVASRRVIRYSSTEQGKTVRYAGSPFRYVVQVPAPAPAEIQVHLELGAEDNGVWAHIPELDVSAEGAHAAEALGNVVSAARDWLRYIQEEGPQLSDELSSQAQYVALLDAPEFSWFRSVEFAESH